MPDAAILASKSTASQSSSDTSASLSLSASLLPSPGAPTSVAGGTAAASSSTLSVGAASSLSAALPIVATSSPVFLASFFRLAYTTRLRGAPSPSSCSPATAPVLPRVARKACCLMAFSFSAFVSNLPSARILSLRSFSFSRALRRRSSISICWVIALRSSITAPWILTMRSLSSNSAAASSQRARRSSTSLDTSAESSLRRALSPSRTIERALSNRWASSASSR
mmetsp:Transcript_16458/g.50117  ORF Transcript_16458/g.50117 Transcript_16458/m.50117 type:complete len:225 (-) Transcript_16458:2080-2754(-)